MKPHSKSKSAGSNCDRAAQQNAKGVRERRVGRRREAARKLWHSLVVKKALGTITPRERMILERYTVLLRPPMSAVERKRMEQMSWKLRTVMKLFGKLMHEAAHAPTCVSQTPGSHIEPARKPKL